MSPSVAVAVKMIRNRVKLNWTSWTGGWHSQLIKVINRALETRRDREFKRRQMCDHKAKVIIHASHSGSLPLTTPPTGKDTSLVLTWFNAPRPFYSSSFLPRVMKHHFKKSGMIIGYQKCMLWWVELLCRYVLYNKQIRGTEWNEI